MFATSDFDFDLTRHPCQFISRHRTTSKQEWDKYHAHPGMEFIFVHQGQGLVIIDQDIYPFGPGTLMYFQPFQLHHVKAELSASCYIRSKMLFEPSLIYPRLAEFPTLQHFFRHLWEDQLTHQILQLAEKNNDFESLFALQSKMRSPLPPESQENFSLFAAFFFQLVRHAWQPPAQAPSDKPKLRHIHYAEKIMQWIHLHFREEFKLEMLAQELHLSNYHISHLFKKATGSSITDYLISYRLRKACMLLTSSQFSIQEVGQEIGIHNFSYFCRLFKNKYNLSPAQYRSQTLKH
ncbi:MAG: transcriptional regulator with cupin sensor, AraC family [Firmicutes bacterium]|nr:transcriptional regulator with cupin sensor, AraC family [Bacillota bacterium]